MIEVASLRYGVVFKKGFCDPEIFTAFVRDILGVKININEVETEKSFFPPIGNIDSKFDLFAEDQENRIIVDIQHKRMGDHYDRFLYYHCVALLETIKNSKNYRFPLKVYTIVVLTSEDHHKTDVSMIDFDPKNLKGEPLGEIFHKVIYLCPKYCNSETPQPYAEWMRAIEDSLDEKIEESTYTQPEILKLFHQIEKEHLSPQERAKLKYEYSEQEHDQEKIKEGLKEGEKKGLKKGELLGRIANLEELKREGILTEEGYQNRVLPLQKLLQELEKKGEEKTISSN